MKGADSGDLNVKHQKWTVLKIFEKLLKFSRISEITFSLSQPICSCQGHNPPEFLGKLLLNLVTVMESDYGEKLLLVFVSFNVFISIYSLCMI